MNESGTTLPQPVKAERLGPEYHLNTYSVFARVTEATVHEETTYEAPKYSLEDPASQGSSGEERLPPREHADDIQRLLKTLLEERSLALSQQPKACAGKQPG